MSDYERFGIMGTYNPLTGGNAARKPSALSPDARYFTSEKRKRKIMFKIGNLASWVAGGGSIEDKSDPRGKGPSWEPRLKREMVMARTKLNLNHAFLRKTTEN